MTIRAQIMGLPVSVEEKLFAALDVIDDYTGGRSQQLDRVRHITGLPARPARILLMLNAVAGRVVTREQIMIALHPDGDGPESDKSVDVYVSRIRKALPPGVAIEPVWGEGYRLTERIDFDAMAGTEARK